MTGSIPLEQVHNATRHAHAAGALVPVQSEQQSFDVTPLPFDTVWLSSLSLKEMATRAQHQTAARDNPFLPFERDLYVADLSTTHVMILNKFQMADDHCLVITRDFEQQTRAISEADLAAIAPLFQSPGGVFMFNGGPVGGASQSHKHFHFMPHRKLPLDTHFRSLLDGVDSTRVPEFRFRHILARMSLGQGDPVEQLAIVVRRSLESCGLRPDAAGELPPYNLLGTRDWLLTVARSAGSWTRGGVSVPVHGMCFGGTLFVMDRDQIPQVASAGLLAILEATATPL